MIKKLWLRIRVWNTGWNPLYSPSLDYLEQANKISKAFFDGFSVGVARAKSVDAKCEDVK